MQLPENPQPADTLPSVLDTPPINVVPFVEVLCMLLQRADLKGGEVPTYTEAWNVLQALKAGEMTLISDDAAQQVRMLEHHVRALSDEKVAVLDAFHNCPATKAAVQAYHANKANPVSGEPDLDAEAKDAADAVPAAT